MYKVTKRNNLYYVVGHNVNIGPYLYGLSITVCEALNVAYYEGYKDYEQEEE